MISVYYPEAIIRVVNIRIPCMGYQMLQLGIYGESKNKYVVDNQIIVVVYASIQRICVGLFVHGTLRIYVHA